MPEEGKLPAVSSMSVWGVRAGKGGAAENLFLRDAVIALEGNEIGDLRRFGDDREALRKAYIANHPHLRPRQVAVFVGQLHRLLNDVQRGDSVLYVSARAQLVYLGRVVSDYQYVESSDFPHLRRVIWEPPRSTTDLSTSARQELNSMIALFRVTRHAVELLSLFPGHAANAE
jgi:restriction system protein